MGILKKFDLYKVQKSVFGNFKAKTKAQFFNPTVTEGKTAIDELTHNFFLLCKLAAPIIWELLALVKWG